MTFQASDEVSPLVGFQNCSKPFRLAPFPLVHRALTVITKKKSNEQKPVTELNLRTILDQYDLQRCTDTVAAEFLSFFYGFGRFAYLCCDVAIM